MVFKLLDQLIILLLTVVDSERIEVVKGNFRLYQAI